MTSSDALPDASCVDPSYSVVMTRCDENRLRVMAGIRELRPELTPKAVKAMIDEGEIVAGQDLNLWDAQSLAARVVGLDACAEIRNWQNEYVYEHYRETRPPKPYPG